MVGREGAKEGEETRTDKEWRTSDIVLSYDQRSFFGGSIPPPLK